jgi:hypothetical protein
MACNKRVIHLLIYIINPCHAKYLEWACLSFNLAITFHQFFAEKILKYVRNDSIVNIDVPADLGLHWSHWVELFAASRLNVNYSNISVLGVQLKCVHFFAG